MENLQHNPAFITLPFIMLHKQLTAILRAFGITIA
ncbi:hypothetical protein BAZSYMA_ACONTIG38414_0 [Bathymodiolus azoricus thioautotrophic gill symbiont]|uniref:Uncharacterized protein n=1 Tax=Bathymodiolus azoricus thioautotrophic gill symbiont TaxID=235205 RepID=A0A1H6KWP7_9GAMM|nr:hypothetical protein BAZSYMA_ACONTIG38414_0 [Bathymodiolus azoricus thioautotrophic gill symbiont]